MKRLMRYKTLQCFLAALIMIAFLAPSAYASGAPDAYEVSVNAVSEKYIGKTVPGACVVISEHDNRVTSMTFRLAHDYVPAGPLNGFAGSFLSLGSYILLTVLWLLGLGCTQVSLLREDSMGIPEFYNVTWIPWLVLGLAAVGMYLLVLRAEAFLNHLWGVRA